MAERARRAAAARRRRCPLTLHLEGESPLKYFSRGSRLVVRSRAIASSSTTVAVGGFLAGRSDRAAAVQTIVLETDQVFAPADRSRRSADRRHLGLRIFKCELRPAPAEMTTTIIGAQTDVLKARRCLNLVKRRR